MRTRSPGSEQDVLDRIEDFIETKIEKNIKRLLKPDPKRKNDRPGPFSYIEAFLKDKNVAAVIPSTKFIIERVLKMIDWKNTRAIVEYGPAEGVITKRLLERLPADGFLAAVETHPGFVASLSKLKDPRLQVIHGSVLDIKRHLAPVRSEPVDAIVSGIPFSYLKPIERHQLLHRTEERLRPGGRFIAYQVTAHLIPLMKYHFEDVDMQYELRNIPPHFVFTGFK